MKNKPLLFLIIPTIIILLGIMIFPFFNTGLNLKIIPENVTIIIDGDSKEISSFYKISPGKHTLLLSARGFEDSEEIINIRWWGSTYKEIKLTPLKLNEHVPYNYNVPDNIFFIEGDYKETGEPYYTVNYLTEEAKNMATSWLKNNNIDSNNVEVIFIEDGD